ncbi:MAG TPA: hypothetical protein PKA42_02545 [Candidatus Paceibacterota bacterium]|nr:hypothetical protein [Candidatus Paceibacterota bacterium]
MPRKAKFYTKNFAGTGRRRRVLVFWVVGINVQKCEWKSRGHFTNAEYCQAFEEAREFFRSKPAAAKSPAQLTPQEPRVIITDSMRAEGARHEWYHRCRHSDF